MTNKMVGYRIETHEFFPQWKSYRIKIIFTEELDEDPMFMFKNIILDLKNTFIPRKSAVYTMSFTDDDMRTCYIARDIYNNPMWTTLLDGPQFDDAFNALIQQILNSRESFTFSLQALMTVQFTLPPARTQCDIEYGQNIDVLSI